MQPDNTRQQVAIGIRIRAAKDPPQLFVGSRLQSLYSSIETYSRHPAAKRAKLKQQQPIISLQQMIHGSTVLDSRVFKETVWVSSEPVLGDLVSFNSMPLVKGALTSEFLEVKDPAIILILPNTDCL